MSDDPKKLSERLNAILKQLDGLSVQEIKVMLCNVELEINQSRVVSISEHNKAIFNGDLRPTK